MKIDYIHPLRSLFLLLIVNLKLFSSNHTNETTLITTSSTNTPKMTSSKQEFILTYPYNTKEQHNQNDDETRLEIENFFNKYKHLINNFSINLNDTLSYTSTSSFTHFKVTPIQDTTSTIITTQLDVNTSQVMFTNSSPTTITRSTTLIVDLNKFKELISFRGRNYTLFNVTTQLHATAKDLYDQFNPLLSIGKIYFKLLIFPKLTCTVIPHSIPQG